VNKQRYETWSLIIAFALKLTGVLGIIFVPVFWAITGRIELAFLPFFGTLAGWGRGSMYSRKFLRAKESRSDEL
jgi:hypothetical protein